MMSSDQRLLYMADQIARNFSVRGAEAAATATADHIQKYWEPRMKRRAFELMDQPDVAIAPVTRAALERVRGRGDATN